MEFNPETLSSKAIYKLLTGSIIPRPIAWIATIDDAGTNNLAPFSYFNMVGDDPPHVMFSTQRLNNSNKDTLNNVLSVKQFVVNMVTEPLVEQMNRALRLGWSSRNDIQKSIRSFDELKRFYDFF